YLQRPFFIDYTATPRIYTLSLHDALPICTERIGTIILSALLAHSGWHWMTDRASAFAQYDVAWLSPAALGTAVQWLMMLVAAARSEEHTSELQSRENLVCRLLLEKKKYR